MRFASHQRKVARVLLIVVFEVLLEESSLATSFEAHPVKLSRWMYIFKPFEEIGKEIPIGTLRVEILEGKGLPKMDLIGSCDTYVVVELNQQRARTKTIPASLSPAWNSAKFVFNVYSPFDSLKVFVWDHDVESSDDFIGLVEIPLADLNHELEIIDWFTIRLDPLIIKSYRQRHQELPIAEIKVKVQYTFSKLGDFFSHFNPPSFKKVSEPEFEVVRIVSETFRLLRNLQPIFAIVRQALSVFFWQDTFKSMSLLLILIHLILFPWYLGLKMFEIDSLVRTFWPLAHLILLGHMIKCYVVSRDFVFNVFKL
jgi:hypothetical protein